MKLNTHDLSDLPDILKNQLQKNIELEIGEKIIKKGKLDLFKVELNSNLYDISIYLNKGNNKTEIVKVPYPFVYEFYKDEDEDLFYFDYRVTTFCNNDAEKTQKLKTISETYKKSKYFNNILVIKCKNL